MLAFPRQRCERNATVTSPAFYLRKVIERDGFLGRQSVAHNVRNPTNARDGRAFRDATAATFAQSEPSTQPAGCPQPWFVSVGKD